MRFRLWAREGLPSVRVMPKLKLLEREGLRPVCEKQRVLLIFPCIHDRSGCLCGGSR